MDPNLNDSGRSDQTVNEDVTLNAVFDTIESGNGVEKKDDIKSVIDEVPEISKDEIDQTDRCLMRYFINRQYGYNIFPSYHSSLHAVRRLNLSHKLTGENSTITSLSFNENGNFLVSGSNENGTITIWDWEKKDKIASLQFIYPDRHGLQFYQLKWLPLDFERFIISSDSVGNVCMLNIRTGEDHQLHSDPNNRHSLATHRSFPFLILSADDDSNVFSIDLRDHKVTKLLSVKNVDGCCVQLFSIDTNPLNGYEFCVAGNMSCVNVYDRRVPTACLYQMYPEHMGLNGFRFVDHVLYNHNGSEIIAAYADEAIYLFDTASAKQRRNYRHRYGALANSINTIKDVNFLGPNSEFVVASSDTGHILIWEKKSEALVRLIRGDETLGSLKPHPHIPILASSDKDIHIWTPSLTESTSNIPDENIV